MVCEFCGREPDTFILVPIRGKQGALEMIACMECAVSRGVYCTKHERIHLGFEDGTHACVLCIEEDVRANLHRSDAIAERLDLEFDEAVRGEVIEQCMRSLSLIGGTVGHALVRSIATLARRAGTSFEEMMEWVIEAKSDAPFTAGAIPESRG